jgi:hypothetical protein
MIHSFTVTFGAKYLTGLVTSEWHIYYILKIVLIHNQIVCFTVVHFLFNRPLICRFLWFLNYTLYRSCFPFMQISIEITYFSPHCSKCECFNSWCNFYALIQLFSDFSHGSNFYKLCVNYTQFRYPFYCSC